MSTTLRDFVRQRANSRCEYCLLPQAADEWPFHVGHVIALQKGGGNTIDNLCWVCSRCNLNKESTIASFDPQAGEYVNLYYPRLQLWRDHFILRDGYVVGLTSIGRATAWKLQMNDEQRVALRHDLLQRGQLIAGPATAVSQAATI
jgi:hypothetical protein